MNKQAFLTRLEQALAALPEEERRNAMEYYENYLEEAGPDHIDDALSELGAPEKVAADILREFRDVGVLHPSGETKENQTIRDRFHTMDNGQKALLIVLGVICAMFLLPAFTFVVGGAGSVAVSILLAIFCVLFCVPLLAFCAWCAAAACIVGIFFVVTEEVSVAVLLIGLALLFAAAGILLGRLTGYVFRVLFPTCLRKIVDVGHRLFHREDQEGKG